MITPANDPQGIMSNEAEILPNLLQEDTYEFEIVMRGYNRRQVDDYIARFVHKNRELEARLARAHDDSERLRREMAELREARKPTGDDLSDRLRQIINLAEDEAQDKVAQAEAKGAEIREDAEHESNRIIDDARSHADKNLAQAQEKADNVLDSAERESASVLSAAKQEAEQTVTSARLEAERTLTASERRASVINEGATHRLTSLTKNHTQALQRLTEISETLHRLLTAENEAGPLEKMVEDAVRQSAPRKQGPPAPAASKPPAAKPASGGGGAPSMLKPEPVADAPAPVQQAEPALRIDDDLDEPSAPAPPPPGPAIPPQQRGPIEL
ncbi:hypothetical protein GCM10022254_75850 [Actinomadura meridiana]|uniref:Uncharacterized protein n=1 Tax=Actinomadura meridiana TaxID=559626 RepID=A0ABP8CSS2_9ACTN